MKFKFESGVATREELKPQKIEILLNDAESLKKLENFLTNRIGQEAAEQCAFVLKSMMENDFNNRCQDATKAFGVNLTKRFGDEESFFELVPDAIYGDAQSTDPLEKIGYRGKHHSVGLLEMKDGKEIPLSLIFDLTYGNVSPKSKNEAVAVFYVQGDQNAALNVLNNHYGGKWERKLILDKKIGKFVYGEK